MGDGCGQVAPEGGVPEVAGMTNMLDDRPWVEKEVPAKPQVRIGTFSVRRWVAIVAVGAVAVGGPPGGSHPPALPRARGRAPRARARRRGGAVGGPRAGGGGGGKCER